MWYFHRYELTSFSGQMMSMTSSQRRHTHFTSSIISSLLILKCTWWGLQPCVRLGKGYLLGFLSGSESLRGHLVFLSFIHKCKQALWSNKLFCLQVKFKHRVLQSATTAWTTCFITESWYNKTVVILLLPSISPSLVTLHFPNQAIHVWTWYHLPSWITRLRYASISTKNSQEPLILSLLASY